MVTTYIAFWQFTTCMPWVIYIYGFCPWLLAAGWDELCHFCIHPSGLSKGEGYQADNLSRWYPGVLQQQGDLTQPIEFDKGPVSMLGPYHLSQEVPTSTNTRNSVSGPTPINTLHAGSTAHREDQQNKAGSQGINCQDGDLRTEDGSICGYDNGSKASNLKKSPLPLALTGSDKQSSANGKITGRGQAKLQPNGGSLRGSQTGVTVVGTRSSDVQCHSADDTSTRLIIASDATCQGWEATLKGQEVTTGGLWSINEQSKHINCEWQHWQWKPLPRIRKHHSSGEDRQHTNQGLHQPLWGDKLATHECIGSGSMEHRETDFCTSQEWATLLQTQSPKLWGTGAIGWFTLICSLEFDLFASRLTHQLERYLSWRPDPAAEATDAFTPVSRLRQSPVVANIGSPCFFHSPGPNKIVRWCRTPWPSAIFKLSHVTKTCRGILCDGVWHKTHLQLYRIDRRRSGRPPLVH